VKKFQALMCGWKKSKKGWEFSENEPAINTVCHVTMGVLR
jgi:hypothetical protein